MMHCIRAFATGLFFGAGALVAFVLYQAVSTAFWYYVASTAMDYAEDADHRQQIEEIYDYSDSIRLGERWTAR
jgi:hypothetical protein